MCSLQFLLWECMVLPTLSCVRSLSDSMELMNVECPSLQGRSGSLSQRRYKTRCCRTMTLVDRRSVLMFKHRPKNKNKTPATSLVSTFRRTERSHRIVRHWEGRRNERLFFASAEPFCMASRRKQNTLSTQLKLSDS